MDIKVRYERLKFALRSNLFFLFVNIPLAILSWILKVKDRFSVDYEGPIGVLSVLNALIGTIAWILFIMLIRSPKFS